ncbi:MAG: type 2 isopentenyl-diphosphate Delta-isomerase [Ignavibacteriales bacterium]|nr:MAG: type 2 isopentenyl-diphosphate Delta-isomerase [Ignavibacteriales bacterium]
MKNGESSTSKRKKEHLELCLTDDVAFQNKTTGFEKYDFIHNAVTEVDINEISFETKFLKKKIKYPFLISCMTGGVDAAESINAKLSVAANELNISLGVGSQRQAFENSAYHQTYKVIRQNAPNIPILGNIGAPQIAAMKSFEAVQFLVDLIEADAMVIHLNPAQELMQPEGDILLKGLLKNIKKLVKILNVPVIVKEVGAGISRNAAIKLLECGVTGIDVAGAGGTSWTGVELLRKNENNKNEFWDWGLPTSYCIKEVSRLKKKYKFTLIGSGGINSPMDAAKSLALGADMTASARIILQELNKNGAEGVIRLINDWFDKVRKVMYLTGSSSLQEFKKNKIVKKENFY